MTTQAQEALPPVEDYKHVHPDTVKHYCMKMRDLVADANLNGVVLTVRVERYPLSAVPRMIVDARAIRGKPYFDGAA